MTVKLVSSSIDWNRIGGVMVSVLASSSVDSGFEPRSGQTKDYKIGWLVGSKQDIVGRHITVGTERMYKKTHKLRCEITQKALML